MSDKKTLSQWLRRPDAYHAAEDASASGAKADKWRESLLADYEQPTLAPPPANEQPTRTPLQVHHLVLLAPAGAALFGLGWLFGNGSMALEQVAKISPLVWMGLAVSGSLAFLMWRGRSLLPRR